MPIKFRCLYCDQLLGIARRKMGTVVNCPKCGRALTVPRDDVAAAQPQDEPERADSILERRDFDRLLGRSRRAKPVEEDAAATESSPVAVESLAESQEPDAPVELAEQDEKVVGREPFPPPPMPQPIRHRPASEGESNELIVRLAAAAVLLLVFGMGVLVGRYGVPSIPSDAAAPQPDNAPAAVDAPAEAKQQRAPKPKVVADADKPLLSGTIFFEHQGQPRPDAGSVVLLLPVSQTPGRKIVSLGLGPFDQNLQDKPGVDQLREYGGQVAVVDGRGDFRIRADQAGMYYVLILSRHTKRFSGDEIYPDDSLILNRFFEQGEELLGDSAFLLVTRELRIERNEPIRFTFKSSVG